MKSTYLLAVGVALALSATACSRPDSDTTSHAGHDAAAKSDNIAAMDSNPFFAVSTLPFQAPPFDQIRNEHFLPAFEKGMAEHLAEIEAIANNPDAPTFENTLVALEKSGQLLGRLTRELFRQSSEHTNDGMDRTRAVGARKQAA